MNSIEKAYLSDDFAFAKGYFQRTLLALSQSWTGRCAKFDRYALHNFRDFF